MALPTVTIRGKKYTEPHVDRLKRKQAKQLQDITKRAELNPDQVDFDSVWEMVGLMVPKLPEDVLDDLEFGECKTILEDAGVMQFSEEDDSGEPTEEMGKSSAS